MRRHPRRRAGRSVHRDSGRAGRAVCLSLLRAEAWSRRPRRPSRPRRRPSAHVLPPHSVRTTLARRRPLSSGGAAEQRRVIELRGRRPLRRVEEATAERHLSDERVVCRRFLAKQRSPGFASWSGQISSAEAGRRKTEYRERVLGISRAVTRRRDRPAVPRDALALRPRIGGDRASRRRRRGR